MKDVKAQEPIAPGQGDTPLFENPEITAVAAISKILQELPDDDSRLRVMRWSFGRFSPEFTRPLSLQQAATASATVPGQSATPAAAPTDRPAPLPATDVTRAPLPLVPAGSHAAREVAPADDATALDVRSIVSVVPELDVDRSVDHADFAGQISELHDLFPAKPKADGAIDWASALTR